MPAFLGQNRAFLAQLKSHVSENQGFIQVRTRLDGPISPWEKAEKEPVDREMV